MASGLICDNGPPPMEVWQFVPGGAAWAPCTTTVTWIDGRHFAGSAMLTMESTQKASPGKAREKRPCLDWCSWP